MAFKRLALLVSAVAGAVGIAAGMTSCGYSLQSSRNALLEKEGVRRVYVKPLVNNTYKPGVENVVYNALVRTLLAHQRVKLVPRESEADAVLVGVINAAQFSASGATTADRLPPLGLPLPAGAVDLSRVPDLDTRSVASVYTALLGCNFSLNRREPVPNRRPVLWTGGFTRSKPFPASNQLDVPGTTSALINESEFERALGEIAVSMMDDVHESMLAMF